MPNIGIMNKNSGSIYAINNHCMNAPLNRILYLLRANAASRAILVDSIIAITVIIIELTKVFVNNSLSQILT